MSKYLSYDEKMKRYETLMKDREEFPHVSLNKLCQKRRYPPATIHKFIKQNDLEPIPKIMQTCMTKEEFTVIHDKAVQFRKDNPNTVKTDLFKILGFPLSSWYRMIHIYEMQDIEHVVDAFTRAARDSHAAREENTKDFDRLPNNEFCEMNPQLAHYAGLALGGMANNLNPQQIQL